jgi:hypothetical protein
MNKKFKIKIPVLFVIFNNFDRTKRVFEEIRRARPKQLFISADGPRTKEEKKKTEAVRKYVLDNIDWGCEVKKLFRKNNLGCRNATVSSISWFFKNVEYGIILEDDCLPSKSFFEYHEQLLEKYKNEDKIKSIAGFNILGDFNSKESYVFSNMYFCSWGVSTWRRAWNLDEKKIKDILEKEGIFRSPSLLHGIIMKKRIKDVLSKKTDGWSYDFLFQNILKEGLTIIPSCNLIENIGFGGETTNPTSKTDKEYLQLKRRELKFPLKHPKKIKPNKKFNRNYLFVLLSRLIKKNFLKIFN